MIPTDSFRKNWPLVFSKRNSFSEKGLIPFRLPLSISQFLLEFGLPDSAAPCLSFVGNRQENEYGYGAICLLNERYDFLSDKYNTYIVIGSDGSGNPVVLDTTRDNLVEVLDHEDLFESAYFVNSSLPQMAACLLVYQQFINIANEENNFEGPDNFTDSQYKKLKAALEEIDTVCIRSGLWHDELNLLLVYREDSQNNSSL